MTGGVPGPALVAALVCAALLLGAGVVFVRSAGVLAGVAAAAAAAVLAVLVPAALVPVLTLAAALAVGTGFAPAWSRREEALAAVRSPAAPADHGWWLVRWRADRAVAALLVLAFPVLATVSALAFHSWAISR